MSDRAENPLVIEPRAASWGGLLRAREPSPSALQMRTELDLPAGAPVVMAGHQAVFWHPGILAKYLAIDAAAAASGALAAWVVVDHDTDDPWTVRYPARNPSGRLVARPFDLRTSNERGVGGASMPACARPAIHPAADLPDDAAGDEVKDGLRAIRDAAVAHAGAVNAAVQVAEATATLLKPVVRPAPIVYSSELSRTTVFRRVVDAMSRDPGGCALSYNAAIAHAPDAGLRALHVSEVNERYELPLWSIDERGVRRAVYAEELDRLDPARLAPRALLMTALLRLGACDLFVHGTGGSLYERANDAWIAGWLGGAAGVGTPAPVSVVTATLRLVLLDGPGPAASDVARARWTAHRARHDPALLGDHEAAARRTELVGSIKTARRRGAPPSRAFRDLHEFLARTRAAHAQRLDALARVAVETGDRARDAEIALDRTWAFPLYPRGSLLALRTELKSSFGGAA